MIAGGIGGATSAAMGPAIINLYRQMGIPAAQIAQLEAQLGNPIAAFFQSCCLYTVIGPVMGCLGGLIGTQVFKK